MAQSKNGAEQNRICAVGFETLCAVVLTGGIVYYVLLHKVI
jgi:hypothetical protein